MVFGKGVGGVKSQALAPACNFEALALFSKEREKDLNSFIIHKGCLSGSFCRQIASRFFTIATRLVTNFTTATRLVTKFFRRKD